MNESVVNKLETVNDRSLSTARLAIFDGSEFYDFLVNPERIEETYEARFAQLPVLYTKNPLVRYQYSDSGIALPIVRFYSYGNNRNLDPVLAKIASWTQPYEKQMKPRLLKFLWGQVEYPRVYLQSFRFTREQVRSGVCTQATGSMVLVPAPETPKAIVDPESTSLTEREQSEYSTKAKEALEADPALRERLKVTKIGDVKVDRTGTVTNDGASLGTLVDVVGPEGLRPGLRNLGKDKTDTATPTTTVNGGM